MSSTRFPYTFFSPCAIRIHRLGFIFLVGFCRAYNNLAQLCSEGKGSELNGTQHKL